MSWVGPKKYGNPMFKPKENDQDKGSENNRLNLAELSVQHPPWLNTLCYSGINNQCKVYILNVSGLW
jgi:hypothetical protein